MGDPALHLSLQLADRELGYANHSASCDDTHALAGKHPASLWLHSNNDSSEARSGPLPAGLKFNSNQDPSSARVECIRLERRSLCNSACGRFSDQPLRHLPNSALSTFDTGHVSHLSNFIRWIAVRAVASSELQMTWKLD